MSGASTAFKVTKWLHSFQCLCVITACDFMAWIKTTVYCGPSVVKCRTTSAWASKTSQNNSMTMLWKVTHQMLDVKRFPRLWRYPGVLCKAPPTVCKKKKRKLLVSKWQHWKTYRILWPTEEKMLHTSGLYGRIARRNTFFKSSRWSAVWSLHKGTEGSCIKFAKGFVVTWNQSRTVWHEF